MNQKLNDKPLPVRFYNTASRSVAVFQPIKPGLVGLYTCGPTVYHYVHLGNLRTYILNDTLKRVLTYNNLEVNHVMNITDVGHLVSDGDDGEDKLEKGATRQGKTAWEVAEFYTQAFQEDLAKLNIIPANTLAPATKEIDAQTKLIQKLFDKGVAYQTEQAIYFDVNKFPQYSPFSQQKMVDKQVAARSEVNEDSDKHNPADFALWFFTVGRFADHQMHWPSPWGEGFPGWHIECSAIAMEYLGAEFDIHTGGVDLIGTHHPNEIAQAEAATGKAFAHYWVHGEFLNIEGGKMSKSKENFYRLQTVLDHGFSPLEYRYFILSAHYRSVLDFDWERMEVASTTYKNLKREVAAWDDATEVDEDFIARFLMAINSDMDMPGALTVVWELVGSELPSGQKRATINKFDEVLGLNLINLKSAPLTSQEQELLDQRNQARADSNWPKADKLRTELAEAGIEIEDTANGTKWLKMPS